MLSPLLTVLFTASLARGGGFAANSRLGRWGRLFDELSLSHGPLRSLPALLNVIRGEMSLIGPRAVSPGEVSAEDRKAWRRFNLRPGLSVFGGYGSAPISPGQRVGCRFRIYGHPSLWGDLAIGLRAIPAAFYGEGVTVAPERIHMMGITFNNLTMEEAVDSILDRARATAASQLCFVNADCVNIAYHNSDYKHLLANSAIVLADGIGLKLAGKILNNNIRQNVNGTDLFPQLCGALADGELGIYLLGGKPGVPEDVAGWVATHYPTVRISGCRHGYFAQHETEEIVADIRRSGASILLVAFGVPRQETWIREHLTNSGVKIAMGVGGLFDFYSGRIPRAPVWVRELGMEWFYRFARNHAGCGGATSSATSYSWYAHSRRESAREVKFGSNRPCHRPKPRFSRSG